MARRKPPPQYQVTTSPVAEIHRPCRRRVLRAWVTGEHRLMDPARITLHAEAAALVMGLRTFEVCVLGKGYPSRRNVSMIEEGYPKYGFIHAQHSCGMCWDSEVYRDSRTLFGNGYDGETPPF